MEIFGLILSAIFMFLFDYFPILIVWLVGLVLAITNRNKYPKAARLTIIGLAILFTTSLVNSYVSRMLPVWLTQQGLTTAEMVPVFTIRNLVGSIISAIGWGFVIAAIFSGRKTPIENNDPSIFKNTTK